MKKALLVLFAFMFAASACFAKDESTLSGTDNDANSAQASGNDILVPVPSAPVSPAQPPDTGSRASRTSASAFAGKVDSVSSDPVRQIAATGDNGEKAVFIIANDATIIGKDGNSTSLDWIDSGDKVNIEYITNSDDTKTAKSIKVSAGW